MPKAFPTRATAEPMWPKAYTPSVLPASPVPTVDCQWPAFRRATSYGRWRSEAMISPQASSAVREYGLFEAGAPAEMRMPRSAHAARSR
jgi:hypothetical protein